MILHVEGSLDGLFSVNIFKNKTNENISYRQYNNLMNRKRYQVIIPTHLPTQKIR